MHASPGSIREPSIAFRADRLKARAAASPARVVLAVERIGYLIPIGDFDGAVHSVFARACNIACGDSLLTVVAPELGDGPTTLRLSRGAPADLRRVFRPCDRVGRHGGAASSRGIALHLEDAGVWRPPPPRPLVPVARIAAHLYVATAALAWRRRTHSSVIDRDGGAVLAGLEQACREFDAAGATKHIAGLIGWGEGLTPAGDDALVGCCAALRALVGNDSARRDFLRQISAAIPARAHRTTPIAAHYLRLAAQGHFNADVTRLRDALLCGHSLGFVQGALDAALAVGATSGADMVTGMIAGIGAWLDGGRGLESDSVARV